MIVDRRSHRLSFIKDDDKRGKVEIYNHSARQNDSTWRKHFLIQIKKR